MPMSNSKQKFTIAVRKFGPFESAMQKFWDQYCESSGCKLELELKIMELHELHESTLIKKGLERGDFDVAHINTDWIYEGYQAGAFEILNPYIDNNPPKDFPQGWSNSLLTLQQFEGNIVGLPFHDGPECFIYRKDLFESHEEQAAYAAQNLG
jgi:multiple sugar transport system substrate-binding protein